MSDEKVEAMIQEKGLNAPRITQDDIRDCIVKEQYHVFEDTTVTVCVLTLKNGFTTVGHSACASPENFDEEVGREIAYSNAYKEIWALEGYLLKQRLHEAKG